MRRLLVDDANGPFRKSGRQENGPFNLQGQNENWNRINRVERTSVLGVVCWLLAWAKFGSFAYSKEDLIYEKKTDNKASGTPDGVTNNYIVLLLFLVYS